MANFLPDFSGVLLDMDGLVLDSEVTYVEAWENAALELGHPLEPGFARSLFGRHAGDVAFEFKKFFGPGFDAEVFFRLAERHWFKGIEENGVAPMPGITQLLSCLQERGIPYALATNSDRPYADLCLERSGLLTAFPLTIARDEVKRGKPEPDLFLGAAKLLGLPASNCLVLEDSEAGLDAAKASGAVAVLIQRQDQLRDKLSPKAHLVFSDLVAFRSVLVQSGPHFRNAPP